MRWAQLAAHAVITVRPGYGIRPLIDATAARAGVALNVVNEVAFLATALWMADCRLHRRVRFRQVVARVRHHSGRIAASAERHVLHLRAAPLAAPPAVDQRRLGGNARSTVGTATDILALIRLLFSRIGQPFVGDSHIFSFNHPDGMCPQCEGLGKVDTVDLDRLFDRELSLNQGAIRFSAFAVGGYRWKRYVHSGLFDDWVIDTGPEAGHRGGRVVFAGTVAAMLASGTGATATHLRRHLA